MSAVIGVGWCLVSVLDTTPTAEATAPTAGETCISRKLSGLSRSHCLFHVTVTLQRDHQQGVVQNVGLADVLKENAQRRARVGDLCSARSHGNPVCEGIYDGQQLSCASAFGCEFRPALRPFICAAISRARGCNMYVVLDHSHWRSSSRAAGPSGSRLARNFRVQRAFKAAPAG